MATPADGYANVILAHLRAVLRPAGFRKQGQRFTAERNDMALRVQLQRSTSSSRDFLRVTVNLQVWSKPLTVALGDPDLTWMFLRDPHWNQRIGFLTPEFYDRWWQIRSDTEAEQAARQIATLLVEYGLPALAQVDSTEKLRDLWQSGHSLGLTDVERQRYLAAVGTTLDARP